ncbi:glycosyltransferase [Acidicapsa dinghuensis]|uniref:Glycosyltransferase n=1 Tax=Acidicapsa dinghuensis TaxID=2218256 RepID=A0ABW1EHB1_9BACT|nr:glycosyltransferase [Acidicapsa dinghuensis]
MAHFGVLSYKGAGHLNPLIALSRQLMVRGHGVTFFLNAEMENYIDARGLGFVPIGASNSDHVKHEKPSGGIAVLRYRMRRTISEMEMFLYETPSALQRVKVDALIIDELALAGPTVAQIVNLPYFILSTSVPHNFGWSAPRHMMPSRSLLDRIQCALLEVSVLDMRGPVLHSLDRFRYKAGLGSIREIRNTFSELAHITQLPRCMDFSRSHLPANFCYAGPFIDESARPAISFPWERLDGRPLVYASMGTTRRCEATVFHRIAEACEGLDIQLVISLGGRRDPGIFQTLPGDPLVVSEAPQLDLLKKAAAVITHAGPNTVFETLMYGKPMVAIPTAFDQPAIAARLAWRKATIVLPPGKLSAKRLHTALRKILEDPSYRKVAEEIQAELHSHRGLERAAERIETAFKQYTESRALSNIHSAEPRVEKE